MDATYVLHTDNHFFVYDSEHKLYECTSEPGRPSLSIDMDEIIDVMKDDEAMKPHLNKIAAFLQDFYDDDSDEGNATIVGPFYNVSMPMHLQDVWAKRKAQRDKMDNQTPGLSSVLSQLGILPAQHN
jgi:hypothetical protein